MFCLRKIPPPLPRIRSLRSGGGGSKNRRDSPLGREATLPGTTPRLARDAAASPQPAVSDAIASAATKTRTGARISAEWQRRGDSVRGWRARSCLAPLKSAVFVGSVRTHDTALGVARGLRLCRHTKSKKFVLYLPAHARCTVLRKTFFEICAVKIERVLMHVVGGKKIVYGDSAPVEQMK